MMQKKPGDVLEAIREEIREDLQEEFNKELMNAKMQADRYNKQLEQRIENLVYLYDDCTDTADKLREEKWELETINEKLQESLQKELNKELEKAQVNDAHYITHLERKNESLVRLYDDRIAELDKLREEKKELENLLADKLFSMEKADMEAVTLQHKIDCQSNTIQIQNRQAAALTRKLNEQEKRTTTNIKVLQQQVANQREYIQALQKKILNLEADSVEAKCIVKDKYTLETLLMTDQKTAELLVKLVSRWEITDPKPLPKEWNNA